MREIQIEVAGKQRKEIAKQIAELLGMESRYAGVPSCDYLIGSSRLDKNGVLHLGADVDDSHAELLLEQLCEQDIESGLPEKEETLDTVTIALPRAEFTDEALENLNKLITAKNILFQHAFQSKSIRLEVGADKVSFPWFPFTEDAERIAAYTEFISKLGNLTQTLKRVQAKEKASDNEKYTFRCFLLRLGFIGDEYKNARKILLENLTGNSAFLKKEK